MFFKKRLPVGSGLELWHISHKHGEKCEIDVTFLAELSV
jgi:hypothetical protein